MRVTPSFYYTYLKRKASPVYRDAGIDTAGQRLIFIFIATAMVHDATQHSYNQTLPGALVDTAGRLWAIQPKTFKPRPTD